MSSRRFKLVSSVAIGMMVGFSGAGLLPGCSAIDKYVPSQVQGYIEDALGLDLSFSISGAPSDEVEQVYFYADRMNKMLNGMHQQGTALIAEFGRTFDLKSEALTNENLAVLSKELDDIDPKTMTPVQKQWLEKNLPAMMGWLMASAKAGDSIAGFSIAIPAAGQKIADNPTRYAGGMIQKGPKLLDDLGQSADIFLPTLERAGMVIERASSLSKATGVKIPTEEEERAMANKMASSTLPQGEEAEFA